MRWNGKPRYYIKTLRIQQEGLIISLKKSEDGGVTLVEYKRDSLNRIVCQSNYRVILNQLGKVIKKTSINSESMSYHKEKNNV